MTTAEEQDSTVHTEPMVLRIGSLYQDRARFQNYPPFQRDKVWGLRLKQVYIDSLLRKWPVNACMLMEDVDEEGKGIYQIIDGQQRIETIFEFLENGFLTMTEQEARSGLFTFEPIEPGCTFAMMKRSVQNRLHNYKMPFITFAKKDEDMLEEIFLRTNNQEPLSVGEQLFIRNSRARHIALTLRKHSFWKTRYSGRTLRKDDFQAALSLLVIETQGFPINLLISQQKLNPLNRLILGEYDDALSDTLKNTIWKRLTAIEHIFDGANIHSKRDIIPVYEAAMFLDTEGFDLLASQKGCLTDWFILSKRGTLHERIRSYHPFAKIDQMHMQKDFWSDGEREALRHILGLVKKDK